MWTSRGSSPTLPHFREATAARFTRMGPSGPNSTRSRAQDRRGAADVVVVGCRRGDSAGSGDAFFRTVVTLSPTAIVVVDAAGGVSFVNEQAETLLNGAKVLGRRFDTLFTSGDEDRATGYLAGLAQAPTSVGMFFTGELAPADGVAGRYVHVHGRNLSTSPGVVGLLLTLIDCTEARQRETDLPGRRCTTR